MEKPGGPADVPAQIGRYLLRSELGRGSMGRVYLAHDPNIDRGVALKLLMPSFEVDSWQREELQKRFLLEARAAGRLNHPGIVAVHDAAIDPESHLAYIAMELVEGRSLESLIEEMGRLPFRFAVEIASQAARALYFAHGRGVIHRDVKPANVMVGSNGAVKLLDFGIAKFVAETHTVVGQVLGTPAYMSPEQLQGNVVDGRSDLFSLGAVLYQTLIGEVPFPSDTVAGIALKIVSEDPHPPGEVVEQIPEALTEIVKRGLKKDPKERFQDGVEFAEALESLAAHLPDEPASPKIAVEPRPRPSTAPGRPAASVTSTFVSPVVPSSGFDSEPLLIGKTVVNRPPATGSPSPFWRTRKAAVLALSALLVVALVFVASRFSESESGEKATATGVEPGSSTLEESKAPAGGGKGESEEIVPSGQATLKVLYENRLKRCSFAVWIDQEQVWSKEVFGSRNFIDRASGETVVATVPVTPGEHRIEVRITGAKKKVDASGRVTASFRADKSRWLKVTLIPLSSKLQMNWE